MYRQQRHTPTQPSQAKKLPQSTHISSSAAIHKVLLNFNLPIAAQTHPCTNLSSCSHRAIIIWNVYAIKTDRIEAETLCQFTNNMLYVEHVFFCQINSHFKSSGWRHTHTSHDGWRFLLLKLRRKRRLIALSLLQSFIMRCWWWVILGWLTLEEDS